MIKKNCRNTEEKFNTWCLWSLRMFNQVCLFRSGSALIIMLIWIVIETIQGIHSWMTFTGMGKFTSEVMPFAIMIIINS